MHFHKKTYTVRKSTSGKGLEVTLPTALQNDGILNWKDKVDIYFSDIVIIVPVGQRQLDLQKLPHAIELATIQWGSASPH